MRLFVCFLLINTIGIISYYHLLGPQEHEIIVPPNNTNDIKLEYKLTSFKRENLLVNISCDCNESFSIFFNISTISPSLNDSNSYSSKHEFVFTNITQETFLVPLSDGYYAFSYYSFSNNTVKITLSGLDIPIKVNVVFGIGFFISTIGLLLYILVIKEIGFKRENKEI